MAPGGGRGRLAKSPENHFQLGMSDSERLGDEGARRFRRVPEKRGPRRAGGPIGRERLFPASNCFVLPTFLQFPEIPGRRLLIIHRQGSRNGKHSTGCQTRLGNPKIAAYVNDEISRSIEFDVSPRR